MDAHTAQVASDRLLGREGLLRRNNMTVIVATHNRKFIGICHLVLSLTVLDNADRIMTLADTVIVLEDGKIIETDSPATLLQNDSYIANPELGAGSLHSWGVAVDCTLTDLHNRDVRMPTDFDDFRPAALSQYAGPNKLVRSHLQLLQVAMAGSGFYAFRHEWWHFTVKNWSKYLPPDEAARVAKIFGSPTKEDL